MNNIIKNFKNIKYGPAPEDDKDVLKWIKNLSSPNRIYINGKWTLSKSSKILQSINPSTNSKLFKLVVSSKKDVDSAVIAANKAYPKWSKLSSYKRSQYLYALARLIQKHARFLSVLESIDNGKPIRETRDIDIPLVARHFYYHAGWAVKSKDSVKSLGVVGQIIPWNFPLLMLAWKIAPAIACGNTVVLKPAEYTSLTAIYFAELCMKAKLPNGVINIVTGDGSTGQHITNHPLVKKIAKTREINKAHTTFIDTIIKHEHKGRIHADINQIRSDQGGTVTGRFSYSNPNLQQIPARNKDLGPMIRSLFIPEDGCVWGCFDYNQQEPRLVVHYASLQQLPSAFTVVDAYKEGNADFHKIVADMAQIPRTQAKTINLGLFYGMGKAKLQAELGVSEEKAKDLFATYHAKVPFVKQLMNAVSQRAQQCGQIRTLLGRLCRFHLWEPNYFGIHKALPHEQAILEHGPGIKRAFTYKSLNKLIQGSAADMTKKCMLELYKEGIIPHIQIHDELDISVKDDKEAKHIVEIMESAVELAIPNKVDYEAGDNWGEIH